MAGDGKQMQALRGGEGGKDREQRVRRDGDRWRLGQGGGAQEGQVWGGVASERTDAGSYGASLSLK